MSELINNKQQRIDTMKSLIRRLHQGEETDSNGQDNFPGGPVGVKQEVDIRHGEHEILENK